MFPAKVIGTVVCTRKYPGLEGIKFLCVQPLDEHLEPVGRPLIAADAMQAGPGEIVYLEDGREGSYALPTTFVPVDAAVVGHVDDLTTVETGNSKVESALED